MRKLNVSMPFLFRTGIAIVGIASLILVGGLARSTSYGTPKCLTETWPDGIASGQTHLTYRINNSCEIVDASFLISEPAGAFDEAALCMARVSHPYGPIDPGRTMTWDQYQAELQTFRETHPERFHDRRISVKTEDSRDAQITCYFNENWQPTEAEISYYIDGEFRVEPFEGFDSLPLQHYISKWEMEE
jgi:hypothetical protein